MPGAAADAPLRLLGRRTVWTPCHRLIPSRFPPTGLFDRVASPEDLPAIFELEALTNDRLRDEAGELSLVAPEDRISGPGTTPIMAAFTHLNPEGSRFSNGRFGVYYCAQTLATALAEVRFHQERFLLRTREKAMRLQLRLYLADLDARLLDARRLTTCHLADDYAPSQKVGDKARSERRDGILYRSVRHAGGTCAAVFRPPVLRNCRQSRHYTFHFDGSRITNIDESHNVWSAPGIGDGTPSRDNV